MAYEEDNLQMSVARYLDFLKLLWCHVGNERRTSIQAGVRLKKKGVKSGVPDILIFEPKNNYTGLAIELKVIKENGFKKNGEPRKPTKGKLSENQVEWLYKLKSKGWKTAVCYTFDETQKEIDNYLK